jgi:transposase
VLFHNRNDIKTADDKDLLRYLDHPLVKLHVTLECQRIKLFSGQIATLEEKILDQTRHRPEFDLLLKVPGVGIILALTIYYELGDILRFADARKFSSYCRLVPGIAQSGNTHRRGRGSKQGNPHLKWAFSQAAIHAVRHHPRIKRCYERHLRRHRGRARKLIAYNVIAHKLAQAVYHVLKNGTVYKEKLLFGA